MALVDDLADLQTVDRPDFIVVAEDVDLARRAVGLLSVKALDRQIQVTAPEASIQTPAIRRGLARAMGGDIQIGGDEGQGARFILSLPAGDGTIPVMGG